jgi:hypothetical protein
MPKGPAIMNNVLCLGDFSSGKSAFFNMLLGVKILPEQLQSTDIPVVKIRSGETAAILVHEPGQKYGRPIASFAKVPEDWSSFEYLELTVPGHPMLEGGLALWDTPGINSTKERQRKHLENFLRSTIRDFQTVLFFVSSNMTNSNIEFLNEWPEIKDKLKIVVNIKQVMPERECRRIENAIKKEVNRRLGNVPVELLYIGDVYDEFAEESDERGRDYTDAQRLALWDKLAVDFDGLMKKHEGQVIGEVIFDILREMHDGASIDTVPLVAPDIGSREETHAVAFEDSRSTPGPQKKGIALRYYIRSCLWFLFVGDAVMLCTWHWNIWEYTQIDEVYYYLVKFSGFSFISGLFTTFVFRRISQKRDKPSRILLHTVISCMLGWLPLPYIYYYCLLYESTDTLLFVISRWSIGAVIITILTFLYFLIRKRSFGNDREGKKRKNNNNA